MSISIAARSLSWVALICAALVALAVSSRAAHAQACSAADDQVRAQYQQAALQALLAGNLQRYTSLQESLPDRLSAPCRAELNRLEPMRVKCTAHEKRQVMQRYGDVFAAAQSGNLMRVFDILQGLEASLSSQCWRATNRHTDPRVVRACSERELDHLTSFAGPLLRASRTMLTTMNPAPLIQLGQQASAPLSQSCQLALVRVQQAAQANQSPVESYAPPSVLDHGGGTYSVPGTGACTPSGCVAY